MQKCLQGAILTTKIMRNLVFTPLENSQSIPATCMILPRPWRLPGPQSVGGPGFTISAKLCPCLWADGRLATMNCLRGPCGGWWEHAQPQGPGPLPRTRPSSPPHGTKCFTSRPPSVSPDRGCIRGAHGAHRSQKLLGERERNLGLKHHGS